MTHLKRGTLWIEEQGPIRWRRVWRNTGYERFRFKWKAATQNDLDVFKAVRNENKCIICIRFEFQLS